MTIDRLANWLLAVVLIGAAAMVLHWAIPIFDLLSHVGPGFGPLGL